MLKSRISDGTGRGYGARVSKQNALVTTVVADELPPQGAPNRYRYYSTLTGTTGAGSGTTNMNENTGTYYIEAHNDYDIHIMRIMIIIADSAASHKAFGNVSVLGTGWDLKVSEGGTETYLIEKAKTGGQVIMKAGMAGGFGNTATSWEMTDWDAAGDATIIYMPIGEFIPGGIRLGRGTTDRIISVVNDNLTGLTLFNVRCVGYSHWPEELL